MLPAVAYTNFRGLMTPTHGGMGGGRKRGGR